jgi:GNAT superfamily N-acetyltransferase
MPEIRRCTEADLHAILAIVNAAAEAYRGVIPADRWREPYMERSELEAEIADGVVFWGSEDDGGALVGVMGIQPLADVDLIRHAYVAPGSQGGGIGRQLIAHLQRQTDRQVLVGTWAAANWAIRFYEKQGFVQVTPEQKDRLLATYWTIPARQVETSVVLAKPPLPPA